MEHQNKKAQENRERQAMTAGIVGIVVNALLCLIKLIAGYITGSVSIVADGFNNLSDAGSSVIAMVGFRLSGKHADKEHPLGHGRIEYITSFVVDIMIILVGIELLQSAFDKILHPVQPDIQPITLVLLGIAIAAKLWMFFYYRMVGNRINAPALRAVALDSISDVVATSIVFLCSILGRFTSLQLDGWAGLLVSIFIIVTGIKATKETAELMMGSSPDPALVMEIYAFTKKYPEIVGVHDLMIHDYGPGRQIVTFHAEVSESSNLVHVHEVIDLIEKDMHEHFGCIVTIHMDPIAVGDATVDALRQFAESCAQEVDPNFSIHDFRIVRGERRTNLIFDLCIPLDAPLHEEEAAALVAKRISQKKPECRAVIRAEHPFI